MSKTIGFWLPKGGTGKTSLTLTAHGFSKFIAKEPALLLDLDGQGAGSNCCDYIQQSQYDIKDLLEGKPADQCVSSTTQGDIVTANVNIIDIGDLPLDTLRKAIEPLKKRYSRIWLDCPPDPRSNLVLQALVACDYLIAPVEPDCFCMDSLILLVKIVKQIRENFNPDIQVGAVVNKYSSRARISREALDALKIMAPEAGIRLFSTLIKDSKSVMNHSHAIKKTLFEFKPYSILTKSMKALFTEIEEWLNER